MWYLNSKYIGKYCAKGDSFRDQTKEEIINYIDWDIAEDKWAEEDIIKKIIIQ